MFDGAARSTDVVATYETPINRYIDRVEITLFSVFFCFDAINYIAPLYRDVLVINYTHIEP